MAWDSNSVRSSGRVLRRCTATLAFPSMLCAAALPAAAGEWQFGASATGRLTLTNNVSLAPGGQEETDLVLAVTPQFTVQRSGARASLRASYTPTVYLYAEDSERNNSQHRLSALMSVEAMEEFFFVDASASIYQSFVSPFGPLPISGESVTDNRRETTTLGLSPYVRGEFGGGYTYLVRNDNFWTTSEGAGLNNLYENRLLANVASPAGRRLRLVGDYDYLYVDYETQPSFSQQVTRLRAIYQVDPDLSINGRVGYESNDYLVADQSGFIYGAGIDWRPTPRTSLSAFVEDRFFGTGYFLDLRHRRRWSAFVVRGSRDTRTRRDQPLTLIPGDTREALDLAFSSRIVDPVERERAIDQFLLRSGLPPELTSPFTFYTNRVYIANQVEATATLFGARNSVSLGLFWRENEPVSAGDTGLPDVFTTFGAFEQYGAIISASHNLSAFSTATISLVRTYTDSEPGVGQQIVGQQVDSTQDTLRIAVTRQLSPQTFGAAGARWVEFDSNIANDFRERALFASITHRF